MNKKSYIHICIIVLISIILEVFLFNINSYRLIGKDYEQKSYYLQDLNISLATVDYESERVIYDNPNGNGWVFIEIPDINTEIGTVYMDLDIPDGKIKYNVVYTDEANTEYYRQFQREYAKKVSKSQYFTCHFSGKSEKMIIRLEGVEEGFSFKINEVIINKAVPFSFEIIRALTVLIILLTLYGIRGTSFFASTQRGIGHNLLLGATSIGFIVVAVVLFMKSFYGVYLAAMYNADFVDAIINKRLTLDIPVSPELYLMINPYDTSSRIAHGVQYSWDTVYYNGNYYCYFGIVPALLFFVPYKIITGEYLACSNVVIITYSLYVLVLDYVVIKILRYKFKSLQFGIEFIGLIILNSAVNLFFFATEPTFYAVLYAVGLMFVAFGFLFFSVWYIGKRKSKLLLFFGALCLALAVGCRPPLLLYTLFIIPFGIKVIIEKRKTALLKVITDMVVLLIPYVTIGGALAVYNYLRFGSFAEFGVTYQLTAQDQLNTRHSILEIPFQLWLGFFQPLAFSLEFPFVHTPDTVTNYAGQFFQGSGITGLLAQVPFLALIFSPTSWKKWSKENDKFSKGILVYTAIIGIMMMIMIFFNSGVEWRYTTEFAPIMCLVAFAFLANNLKRAGREQLKVGLSIVYILALFTLAVSFLKALDGMSGYMEIYHTDFYYKLDRLFCFWK